MRYGSVCSGIEAATVAWHGLGWKAQWYSEIEAFPSAVLAHHYPTVPNLGDMTKIYKRREFRERTIDLLVGGTPCQSFSVAGLRKGMADPRGNLALHFLKILDAARPRWVVWENVPGVLSSGKGRDFGAFLGGLGELGYGWAYRTLDAQYFGVPQRRRRVFVVGYLGDWRPATAVLFERACLSGDPAPSREAREGTASNVAKSLRSHGGPAHREDVETYIPEIAGCLQERDSKGSDSDTKPGHLIPIQAIGTNQKKQNGMGVGKQGDKMFTLTGRDQHAVAVNMRQDPITSKMAQPMDTKGNSQAVVFEDSRRDGIRIQKDGQSPTLQSFSGTGGNNMPMVSAPAIPINTQMGTRGAETSNSSREGVGVGKPGDPAFTLQSAHGHAAMTPAMQVRRLTPRECERLQGFPDDYTLIPKKNGRPAPDGPRYKALGNSMAVPVMQWIGKRIAMVTKELK